MGTGSREKALFESVNNVLRWDYSELLRRFSIPWEEASGLMMLRHEEMLDVYQDAVELIRRLKAAGAHLCIVSNNPYWGCRWKLLRAGLEPVWLSIFSVRIIPADANRWHMCGIL
ncbi:MAG: HAD family hydrolase [Victivallales bacterium]